MLAYHCQVSTDTCTEKLYSNLALNINNDSSGCEKQYLRSQRGVSAITGYRAKFQLKNYASLTIAKYPQTPVQKNYTQTLP